MPVVNTVRLYVLNCGELIFNRPEDYNLKREEVEDTNMPVTCYLVVHPKGILLYDTGLSDTGLSDTLVGRPIYENALFGYQQLKTSTLRSQLADVGVRPKDVKYLAISHSHFDHVGNVRDFPDATSITQKKEYDFMFASDVKASDNNDFSTLISNRKIVANCDFDVFGDGSVVLKLTPGHTPGHQPLFVRLRQTGPVVLTGDLYHYAEERTIGRMPTREESAGTRESRKAIEEFATQEHAQIWIGHSTAFYRNALKSPAWYE